MCVCVCVCVVGTVPAAGSGVAFICARTSLAWGGRGGPHGTRTARPPSKKMDALRSFADRPGGFLRLESTRCLVHFLKVQDPRAGRRVCTHDPLRRRCEPARRQAQEALQLRKHVCGICQKVFVYQRKKTCVRRACASQTARLNRAASSGACTKRNTFYLDPHLRARVPLI